MAVGAGNHRENRDARARRDLARYMFYRANEVIAPIYGMADTAFSDGLYLLEASRAVDDPNLDAAAALGRLVLTVELGDSAVRERAYRDVLDHYFLYPENMFAGEFVSRMAGNRNDVDAFLRVNKALAAAHPDRTDLLMDLIDGYGAAYMQGDSAGRDSALATLRSLEERLGPDPALIMRYAWINQRDLDTAAVVEKIRQFTLSRPTDASALYYTARMYDVFQFPDSTTKYLVLACRADSTYGPAYLALADEYLSRGDSAAYDRTVISVISSPEIEFDDKLHIVQSYFQNAYTDSTRTAFTDTIFDILEDQHAGEPQVYRLHGVYCATRDDYARSAEYFRYALDLDREDRDTYSMLIEAQQKSGDTLGAIATGHMAIANWDDNLYFTLLTAGIEMMSDRPAAALATLDSFDITDFVNPKAMSSYHQSRADALYKLGMPDSAFAEYDRAIEFDPENSMAKNNAAYFMACSGTDLGRARTLAEEAVADDPLNPTMLDTYAWVLFKRKEYREAREQIELALTACGINIEETSEKAVNPKGYDETAPDGQTADTDEEVSSEILDHAGDIFYMNGEPDTAVRFWKMALELDSGNQQIQKKIKHRAYFFE